MNETRWRANEISTASNSAEKKNRPREGVAEGGGWGEFRHARANTKSGQPRRPAR